MGSKKDGEGKIIESTLGRKEVKPFRIPHGPFDASGSEQKIKIKMIRTGSERATKINFFVGDEH